MKTILQMTLKELDQIDRELAEGWMGWVWSKEWQMWHLPTEEPVCTPDELPLIGDPDNLKQTPWHPTRNKDHAFQIDEKMCKSKFTLTLHRGIDGTFVAFYDSRIIKEGLIGSGATSELALSLAAHTTLEGKGE